MEEIKTRQDIETKEKIKEIPIDPCRAICEVCAKEVTTYVKIEPNVLIFFLIAFVLYFYGLLYGLGILLLTVPLFQNVIHSCPYCLDFLFTKYFYPVQIKENYTWLQYGKCVIIVKTIYTLMLLSAILIFGFYINFVSFEGTDIIHDHAHNVEETLSKYYSKSELTWEELIKDCGANVMVENSARANEIFKMKYQNKLVEWKGYFINAYVHNINPFEYNPEHLVNVNIRMIPSESLKNPDLFLSLGREKYNKYMETLRMLKSGDPVKFTAKFEDVGNEWRAHHLHLIEIEKCDDFIEKDHKQVLFQGINFNITGHIKIEEDLERLKQLTNDQLKLDENTEIHNGDSELNENN